MVMGLDMLGVSGLEPAVRIHIFPPLVTALTPFAMVGNGLAKVPDWGEPVKLKSTQMLFGGTRVATWTAGKAITIPKPVSRSYPTGLTSRAVPVRMVRICAGV